MRKDRPAKFDIGTKSDWLLIRFTFVIVCSGSRHNLFHVEARPFQLISTTDVKGILICCN